MIDCMIDFESLGNGKNACVIQVGACYFDRDTGEIGETFDMNIDAESAVRSGADIDAQTVYWWLSQSKEAQNSVIAQPRIDATLAFEALNEFLKDAKTIWSHATFDFVILTETLKRLRIKPSFRYTTARDIRTLVDLANLNMKGAKREGLHHNGLDDCKHQVKYCVEAMKKLKGKT
jgi:hypothetical protein